MAILGILLDCVWPRFKQDHHHCFWGFLLQRKVQQGIAIPVLLLDCVLAMQQSSSPPLLVALCSSAQAAVGWCHHCLSHASLFHCVWPRLKQSHRHCFSARFSWVLPQLSFSLTAIHLSGSRNWWIGFSKKMIRRGFARVAANATNNTFKYPASFREQVAKDALRDGFAILPSVYGAFNIYL